MARIDRKKHDVDVLERVLRDAEPGETALHSEVVRLDTGDIPLGHTTSVVQVTVLTDDEQPGRED